MLVLPFSDVQQAQFVRKPTGFIIVDGVEVARTLQCVHGGEEFISIRGSGITRGFCRNCMGETCGKPECDACVPFERKLEDYEKGKIRVI